MCNFFTKVDQFWYFFDFSGKVLAIFIPIILITPKNHNKVSLSVLAFLAIYRQIRDFGHKRGDKNLGLAIDRQSPKIGDF